MQELKLPLTEANVYELYKIVAGKLLRNPDDVDMLITQWAMLSDNGKESAWPHQVCLAARAYNNNPNDLNAIFNYGTALHRAGKFRQAASFYRQCVARNDPATHARHLHHLGLAYHNLNENGKAIECYNKAIALDPDKPEIKKDLAFALLASGDLLGGLQALEIRKQIAEERLAWHQGELIDQCKLPQGFVQWQGESLDGKSIVVYHEDGIGDFFQMCRFIPLLYQAGAKCVQLTGSLPSVLEVVADNIAVDGIVPLDRSFGSDYVVGSMSLPWRCGVTLDRVSGKPYFKREPAGMPYRGPLNVGLVWRGNPKFRNDCARSMALNTLCPLFEIPGVAFYSLQVGAGSKEISTLGFDGFIADLVPHIGRLARYCSTRQSHGCDCHCRYRDRTPRWCARCSGLYPGHQRLRLAVECQQHTHGLVRQRACIPPADARRLGAVCSARQDAS